MSRKICLAMLLLLLAGIAFAEDWITIYNDDLSLVRSNFELQLKKGRQEINFDDITSRIQPVSVIVSALGGGIRVAEQNYEYDLAGKWQIMAKYLDKEVTLITKDNSRLTGILKFFDGSSLGLIENSTNRMLVISDAETQIIQLASLPDNFYTKPTLRWGLIAEKEGKFPVQLTYLSGGFSWDVTYNCVWDEKLLATNSWVTINNRSGRAFTDVNLKLIAGDINRVFDEIGYGGGMGRMKMESSDTMMAAVAPEFEAKAFHDFHMYTLDQKVSFANNQTKQIALYPTQNVKAKAVYEYQLWSDGVKSIIRFKNTEENGIGKALPKGTIKVYKQDSDGNLEFIGEDRINHTSKNEEVTITTGKAFDLVASTMVKDQQTIGRNVSERTIQVTLRNNSKDVKTIDVIHYLGSNAKIVSHDIKPEIDTNNKATFKVEIRPDTQVIFNFKERTEY
ncbi:MAG: DUF4139 domain-containing protein [Candidatus Cloacimonadaceae bacterium]|nr:DUF4139 domain-containing protein [Candidatus Cloacimonadaceae bacterium]MDP3114442.1 DUF4139 domain-containing protein [Candidatus Cloacimonadaceae bacterium]